MAEVQRFSFEHEPLGTRVLDCFVPVRRVRGTVDLSRLAVAVDDEGGRELARRIGRRLYLSDALLGEGAPPWSWVDVDAAARTALQRLLGPELAGYVASDGLPPGGDETARALVDVASDVEEIGRDRYRLDLEAGTFDGLGDVTVEVAVGGGRVSAVVVAPVGSELGWRVTYRYPEEGRDIVAPAGAVSVDAAALAQPVSGSGGCELPI